MLDLKAIEKLGGWEGYRVERVAWPEDGSRTVTITYILFTGTVLVAAHGGKVPFLQYFQPSHDAAGTG